MAALRVAATPKRTLALFVLAFVITTAELCWWVTFNIKETAKLTAKEAQLQERDCALAQALVQKRVQGAQPLEPQQWLERYFPDLQMDAATGTVAPKTHLAQAQVSHNSAHVRMFVAEGAFFFFMVLLGAALIVRTIRREVGVVRQQANFLNAVTHELKSPLAAMRLYIETLERRQVDPQTLARYVATLRAECDRLDVLVSHVLTLARMEQRGPQTEPTSGGGARLNLDDEVAQVVAQRQGGRHSHTPPIEHRRHPGGVLVAMEQASLRTVLRNLLDNACKYGAQGDRIVLQVAAVQGRAHCLVQDFGIGIAASEQGRIFERFYRVGDEMVRRHEGSGLGLYLVRMLLRDCGGSVAVASDGLGTGATFTVSLPQVRGDSLDRSTI